LIDIVFRELNYKTMKYIASTQVLLQL